jgi:DDE domain
LAFVVLVVLPGGPLVVVNAGLEAAVEDADVLVSSRRDAAGARRFFTRALRTLKVRPREAVTDAAPIYPGVLESCCRRRGTTSSGTPTTRSRRITASPSTGCGPCAVFERIGPRS